MKTWNDFEQLVRSVHTEEEFNELKFTSELIGEIINARSAKGWTQTELAQRTGLKQSAIARLESQSTIPKLDTFVKLTNALGLRLSFNISEKITESTITETASIQKELQDLKNVVQLLNEKLDIVISGGKADTKVTKTKLTVEQTIEPQDIVEKLWWTEAQPQTPSSYRLLSTLLGATSISEGDSTKNQNRYPQGRSRLTTLLTERSIGNEKDF